MCRRQSDTALIFVFYSALATLRERSAQQRSGLVVQPRHCNPAHLSRLEDCSGVRLACGAECRPVSVLQPGVGGWRAVLSATADLARACLDTADTCSEICVGASRGATGCHGCFPRLNRGSRRAEGAGECRVAPVTSWGRCGRVCVRAPVLTAAHGAGCRVTRALRTGTTRYVHAEGAPDPEAGTLLACVCCVGPERHQVVNRQCRRIVADALRHTRVRATRRRWGSTSKPSSLHQAHQLLRHVTPTLGQPCTTWFV